MSAEFSPHIKQFTETPPAYDAPATEGYVLPAGEARGSSSQDVDDANTQRYWGSGFLLEGQVIVA